MGQIVEFKHRGSSSRQLTPHVSVKPVAVFYANQAGEFEFVNSHWCTLMECSQADAMGLGWLAKVHDQDRPVVTRYWHEAVQIEEFVSIKFRLVGPKNKSVILQGLPEYDNDGQYAGYCGTLTLVDPANLQLIVDAQTDPQSPKSLQHPSVEASND